MSTVHVLPERDIIRHEPEDCVCGPSELIVIGPDGGAGRLVSHHKLTTECVRWVAIR